MWIQLALHQVRAPSKNIKERVRIKYVHQKGATAHPEETVLVMSFFKNIFRQALGFLRYELVLYMYFPDYLAPTFFLLPIQGAPYNIHLLKGNNDKETTHLWKILLHEIVRYYCCCLNWSKSVKIQILCEVLGGGGARNSCEERQLLLVIIIESRVTSSLLFRFWQIMWYFIDVHAVWTRRIFSHRRMTDWRSYLERQGKRNLAV